MKIKVDKDVLKKTAIFKSILENPAVCKGKCPELSEALNKEFKSDGETAANNFQDVGICIRAEKIDFKCSHRNACPDCICFVADNGNCLHLDRKGDCKAKVVDIVTGGKDGDVEYAVLVECKFNANPPDKDKTLYCFFSWDDFFLNIAEKFRIRELWEIYGNPVFFVLFNEEVAPLATKHFNRLRLSESDDEERSACIRQFTICDLVDFRKCFV